MSGPFCAGLQFRPCWAVDALRVVPLAKPDNAIRLV